jgi:phosphoribosylglycinamide formyltransferase 1
VNIVIITSNSIRHNYFKVMFSNHDKINVVRTYVESNEKFDFNIKHDIDLNNINDIHFKTRHNIEHDFFSDLIDNLPDDSNSKQIRKGEINDTKVIDEIINLSPDLIITYGCSIIKPRLINSFKNKIINVHLGLSPYYFGSGTNFHCLANNELHFFGYTFMYIDEGIDTGEIIHQARPDVFPFDSPHQIGNRLIKKMVKDFIKLIVNFDSVKKIKLTNKYVGKTYKMKDASEKVTMEMYENFKQGLVLNYLKSKKTFLKKYKIISQDFIN